MYPLSNRQITFIDFNPISVPGTMDSIRTNEGQIIDVDQRLRENSTTDPSYYVPEPPRAPNATAPPRPPKVPNVVRPATPPAPRPAPAPAPVVAPMPKVPK